MVKNKTAFWQKAEGIAYSSKQWMPGLVDIQTNRGTTPHGDPLIDVSFKIEERTKNLEDSKRARLVRLFTTHDDIRLIQLNDTHMRFWGY